MANDKIWAADGQTKKVWAADSTTDEKGNLTTEVSEDQITPTAIENAGSGDIADDGTTTFTAPDGTKTVTSPDGTVQKTSPDGTIMITKNDGSTSVTKPDGTIIFTQVNGTTTQTDPNGTITFTNPDGSYSVTDPDGNMTNYNPDGSVKQGTQKSSSSKSVFAEENEEPVQSENIASEPTIQKSKKTISTPVATDKDSTENKTSGVPTVAYIISGLGFLGGLYFAVHKKKNLKIGLGLTVLGGLVGLGIGYGFHAIGGKSSSEPTPDATASINPAATPTKS